MTPNKGDVIERVVRKKIGISELSRKLQVSRTAIYNWFENGQINLETICKIGQAIDHDFTNEFPEEFANAQNLSPDFGITPTENKDGAKSVDYWINKYINLLEQYNDLLLDLSYPNSKTNSVDLKTGISENLSSH
ncbi:helix-turn-helix transcriptional regulator [Pedobacter sp. N36a]|uniref:helix-turn-helix domain-containing protein n=1 Tax=Pedobacter sp. N36a TaxID=2767996 RepID=UPI001656FE4C|nr:helix-turn-helix transcriptional regulator [Pedobacter sp. N36a]MBC8986505.1 helix-turn-helix transcriptional regulator [Pedobacter sp. N36a]